MRLEADRANSIFTPVWTAAQIQDRLLERLFELAALVKAQGVRPRLVIFDRVRSPVYSPVKVLADQFAIHVQLENLNEDDAGAALSAQLELLEKSRGVHGVLFPTLMPEQYWQIVAQHRRVQNLELNFTTDSLSCPMLSFLQLAKFHSWSPKHRRVVIINGPSTRRVAASVAAEFRQLGADTHLIEDRPPYPGSLWYSDLIWLCTERRIDYPKLHLNEASILVDSGSALDLAPSLSAPHRRLAGSRLKGLCPAVGGLGSLVNINRMLELLGRGLKTKPPRRPRKG